MKFKVGDIVRLVNTKNIYEVLHIEDTGDFTVRHLKAGYVYSCEPEIANNLIVVTPLERAIFDL